MEFLRFKFFFLFFIILFCEKSFALSEHQAGELCGGWKAGNRTELDDQVFYECIEKTSKGLPFNELTARNSNALKICGEKGNDCVFALLKEPSRLAIKLNKKKNARNIASIKEHQRAPKSIKGEGFWQKVVDFFSW